jgi:hypothetical protein
MRKDETMLASALSTLSDRFDAKFLIAYWLPPFVAALGGIGILAVLVGGGQLDAWVQNLDSVEQTLTVILFLLTVTMAAFVLRALSRPIIAAFAGEVLPDIVADWARRGQINAKRRAAPEFGPLAAPTAAAVVFPRSARRGPRVYPIDEAAAQPTRFGNVLAAALEHPELAHAMEGLLWWPRLSQVVPESFQVTLSAAQAPMMAFLNFTIVFVILGVGGVVIFILAGGHMVAAIVVLIGGLLLARLCYHAAVGQAVVLANLVRVGFDLYRHEILRQMDVEIPTDPTAERAIWQQLTAQLLATSPLAPQTDGDRSQDRERTQA